MVWTRALGAGKGARGGDPFGRWNTQMRTVGGLDGEGEEETATSEMGKAGRGQREEHPRCF